MSQLTTEQALQIPQQLKQQEAKQQSNSQDQAPQDKQRKILTDDAVTLLMQQNANPIKKVKVESFKGELGQEKTFINETLKNKLAEYKLNPNTRLAIQKDAFGKIELQGSLLASDLEKLNQDLNNNKLFKSSFDKLSQQEPTLKYVDNVVKISKVYGVQNTLFNSLISDQNEFNKLNDIAHRYEALKNTNPGKADLNTEAISPNNFNFVLNA
tara:strand:- start:42252 stop:42887 length:636 start_codon:yes stop_codon:yes gene_type:complete